MKRGVVILGRLAGILNIVAGAIAFILCFVLKDGVLILEAIPLILSGIFWLGLISWISSIEGWCDHSATKIMKNENSCKWAESEIKRMSAAIKKIESLEARIKDLEEKNN